MSRSVILAFGSGMLAAVNPCGFAMLPAYLSYFVGIDDPSTNSRRSVLRALGVGALLTVGFVAVFGSIGIAARALALPVERYAPWITLVIGGALVVVGIVMIAGKQLTFGLPKLERGGTSRSAGSTLLFGVSYAIASLSCTLPIFTVNVLLVFSAESFGAGMAVFAAYAVGMGLLITALTVSLALARSSLLNRLRAALPYISRVAGGFLIVGGVFVAYWGWWEIQVLGGNLEAGGPADTLLRWQSDLAGRIDRLGPLRIGLVLAVFMAAALAVTSRRSGDAASPKPPARR
ncbi:MAG: cytochrome c biogenesis protein CcdA [Acidimicrobiia bacterium]|nr:cytochrome c biogenesis protein CcdA [Acidimicrobiia bacterium]